MSVQPGDRFVVHATHVGGHEREGEVVAARGPDGGPPYVVRWADSGTESLFFPGSDTVVRHGEAGERVSAET